jgi:hypothetical protein
MIAPIWISLRSRALLIRFGSVLIFGILSAPIIIAIDRGNIIGYLGIVLYFFAVSVLNKSWHIASVFGAIAVSIKLFPVVIFAVFLIYGKWKQLLLGMLYSMVLVVGLLSTFPGKFTDTLSGFWSGFAMFRNVDPNLLYCGNQSLIGGLLSWLDRFGMIGLSQFIIENTLLIGGFLSMLILGLMVKYKNEVWLVLVLSLSTITAAPALVYSYTMIWVLPALAIVFLASNFDFLRNSANFNSERDGKQRNKLYFVTTVYLTILLVPYPIQWHHQLSLLCTSSVYHVVYFTATCFWIGFLFANKLGREENRVQLS